MSHCYLWFFMTWYLNLMVIIVLIEIFCVAFFFFYAERSNLARQICINEQYFNFYLGNKNNKFFSEM